MPRVKIWSVRYLYKILKLMKTLIRLKQHTKYRRRSKIWRSFGCWKIYLNYKSSLHNYSDSDVQRYFRLTFNCESPYNKSIQNNVAKYHNFGTRLNKNERKSAATDEDIERVRTFFENNVKLKADGIGLGLFASSFNHIACSELK